MAVITGLTTTNNKNNNSISSSGGDPLNPDSDDEHEDKNLSGGVGSTRIIITIRDVYSSIQRWNGWLLTLLSMAGEYYMLHCYTR